MVDKELYDAVIVGGGPAGLTAAMYLARACYRVIVVEKEKFGGQITITSEVVNYPGADPQSGEELTERMRKQAESFGAEFMLAEVKELDFSEDIKIVKTTRGNIRCLGVMMATGAHPRMVGFKGEAEFKGHGVAYCATCDGEFFTGKEVFVVGGGFAAAEEAVFLTRYASHVTILIRGDDFTCAKETADETRANPNITVLTNTEVVAVEGDSVLRKITYKNNKTGEETVYSPENGDTFGVFVFAGYEPSTELVKDIAELNPQGYVVTNISKQTSKEGLFAAGDVCIKTLRQVVTATGDGAIAATEMEKYLSKERSRTGLETEMPIKRASVHKVTDTAKDTSATKKSDNNELLDDGMKAQLMTVFDRMTSNLILEIYPDDRKVSLELKGYMEALASLTDKLSIKELDVANDETRPFVKVLKEDGTPSGITFHGAPGGHEFTSFVLGLYNAAGPGQGVPVDVKAKIDAIDKPTPITVMVSLSCTMCPELVTAAGRIATLNPNVQVDIFDLNHFPALKDKYNVMSVPCFVIGDKKPEFGKKNVEELVNLCSM
ncbi:MAG: FAD-dependent oxidoreductase [Lachnospiraceae bacterium]|nr:FAD-dependent oxidoreductase [Lachnospiraceae bacterium]